MPATYVTAATLKASLGVGTLYDSYTWIEDTCQAAQDLINGILNVGNPSWDDMFTLLEYVCDNEIVTCVLGTEKPM